MEKKTFATRITEIQLQRDRSQISRAEAVARITLFAWLASIPSNELDACMDAITSGIASGTITVHADGRPTQKSTARALGRDDGVGKDLARLYWVDRLGFCLTDWWCPLCGSSPGPERDLPPISLTGTCGDRVVSGARRVRRKPAATLAGLRTSRLAALRPR